MKTAIRIFLAALLLSLPLSSNAGVFVSVTIAPPPLLVYEQPPPPAQDYIWIPGYWAWDEEYEDYYWVPGTWVIAPRPRYYWTPGYWAWIDYAYVWHPGYWGPRVGYYGGINYGFGYTGYGYQGGRWENDHFHYNRAVNNVNVQYIRNTYNTTVINHYSNDRRTSYNGGDGGVWAKPRPDEQEAARERHIDRTDWQDRHEREARRERAQFASRGRGDGDEPRVVAATAKPAEFKERNVVRAPRPEWNRARAEIKDDVRNDRNERSARSDAREQRRIERESRRSEREPREGADVRLSPDDSERVVELNRSVDVDKPLRNERSQSRRQRDRSEPADTEALRPDISPRDLPRREREPRERFERVRPIEREELPSQPAERPQMEQRMERRMERSQRPDREERREKPEVPRFEERQMERPQMEQRLERRSERPSREERPQFAERAQRTFERPERPQREERSPASERPQRAERPSRGNDREDRRGDRGPGR
jgi:hypothetical protein